MRGSLVERAGDAGWRARRGVGTSGETEEVGRRSVSMQGTTQQPARPQQGKEPDRSWRCSDGASWLVDGIWCRAMAEAWTRPGAWIGWRWMDAVACTVPGLEAKDGGNWSCPGGVAGTRYHELLHGFVQ
jgi:hypothetical protein